MPYMITRGQALARLRRDATIKQADPQADTRFRHALVESLGRIWWEIVQIGQGYGSATETITAASESPVLSLPDPVLVVRYVMRPALDRASTPELITAVRAGELGLWQNGQLSGGPAAGYYMLEGPGQEVVPLSNPTEYQNYKQRLRFWPSLVAGEPVVIHYGTVAPDLGDPENPADDAIMIDMISEPIVTAWVTLAWWQSAGREDDKSYTRAMTSVQQSLGAVESMPKHRNKAATLRLDQFIRSKR